jgi:hypothetical protein
MTWSVVVVELETLDSVGSIECKSESEAQKVRRGMEINLNHDKFYLAVRGPEREEQTAPEP